MKNITVYNLRKDLKFKVKISHYRWVAGEILPMYQIREKKLQSQIEPHGGLTTLSLIDGKGEEYKTRADCNLTDSFNRKIALQICIGRICKQLGIEN